MQLTDDEAHDALLRLAHEGQSDADFLDSPEVDDIGSFMASAGQPKQAPAGVIPSKAPAPPVGAAPQASAPKPPPIDTSKPINFGAEDTELADLQRKAKDGRAMANLGKVVTSFTERPDHLSNYAMRLGGGGGGEKMAHNSTWDDAASDGDRAVSELMARRKSESDTNARQGAAAKAKEMGDAGSERAQTYRSVLVKFAPDMAGKLETATPEQMEKIAPWLEKYADEAAKQKSPQVDYTKIKQGELDRANSALEETKRHNLAMESRAPKGHNATPVSHVQAGRLDSITDPGDRETVRAIVEGRAPAPAPGSRSGQHIMSLVAQIDPNFDSTKYNTYQHTRNEQATNAGLLAGKAVKHHMDELQVAVDELPEGLIDSPGANKLAQGFDEATGQGKYTRLKTAAAVVGSELAQALGDKDVTGREHVAQLVNPNQTKAQWAKSLPELIRLREEKINASRETLGAVAPTKLGGADDGEIHTTPSGKKLRVFKDGTSEVVE